jgi:hypothetical protein
MAATIATAIGHDTTGRSKTTTRLGSQASTGKAATWRTFGEITLWADGRVEVSVKRDGKTIYSHDIEAEGPREEK